MIFNENLIKQYTGHKRDLAKYVLFSIEQDLRLNSAITNNIEINGIDVKMSWSEDILGDVQEIIIDLLARDIIAANNYEKANSRYKILRPLRVHSLTEIELSDDFITECRAPFFKGYCRKLDRNASAKKVRELLIQFIEINEIQDITVIPKALKLMVDERMKDNPDFVTKISTFIDPLSKEELDGKNLLLYIEEYEQSADNPTRSSFI